MTVSTIVTIIVLAILAVLVVHGFLRGFLRILLTTFSLVITLVVAALLVNPASEFVHQKTSIGTGIEEKVDKFIGEKIDGIVGNSEESVIDELPLPNFLKKSLHENNTIAKYKEQGVKTFREYATSNVTRIVIKAGTYIVLMILVFLLIRLLLMLTRFINKVPIIGGVNRILGAILGLVEGLLIIWALCLIIMAFSATEFGVKCMDVINKSNVLSFIYNNNLLAQVAESLFKVF